MRVRNTPLLVVGLVLLAASGTLAGLLVLDGEVPAQPVAAMAVGDEVRLKGELVPAGAWAHLAPDANHTARLDWPGDVVVLVASADPLPSGVWVVEGTIRDLVDADVPVIVIDAVHWDEPVFG